MSEQILKATHSSDKSPLKIGETEINCYVLEDGTRVLSRYGFLKALGRTGKAKGGRKYDNESQTPVFLTAQNLKAFITNDLLRDSKPIHFKDTLGNDSLGYKAELLPDVLWVFSDAYDKGVLKPNQIHIGQQAKILLKAFTKTTIIALVDEATGYQYQRERFELQKILSAYVSDEILKWQLTFTDDFYKEVYRLWGLPFIPKYIKNKPSFIGKLTTKYIYEEMPKGVLEKIKVNTPKTEKGNWKYKFHQSLTPEIGREHLKKQIIEVTTLMSIAQSKEQFQELFARKYNKKIQLEMEFQEDVKEPELSDFNKKLTRALDYNPKSN
jgi:hypothetical protein